MNLGIKAIIGLAAAGQIATIVGDTANATTWSNAATSNVDPWVTLSTDASAGNYLNVEQGATGTWSSLYNAYYEMVIGASLVPEQVAANQASFYLNQLTTYGMPLQTDAGDLNKVAWLFYLPAWLNSYPIADELMSRNVAYINDTPSLVPYGDRYNTSTGIEVTGIQAHPTLGAVFAILAAQGASSPGPARGTTRSRRTPARPSRGRRAHPHRQRVRNRRSGKRSQDDETGVDGQHVAAITASVTSVTSVTGSPLLLRFAVAAWIVVCLDVDFPPFTVASSTTASR